ncbi:MAG TPA: hypothetical protein GXX75_21610 [Clostridiales bacterium]|nr:hypothetical protein [Clostridiales bacterium]
MLPVINLDDENFIDIFEEARQMISGVYPRWTDYNEHDPGITFLELFAWMKEMQQFHMNQVGKENDLMYLKLLGMKLLHRKPAKTIVKASGVDRSRVLPKGSKLMAGSVSFETEGTKNLEEAQIKACISRSKSREVILEGNALRRSGSHWLFLFGEDPQAGDEFLLQLDRALLPGMEHSIYFKIFEDYPIRRNPVTGDMVPLARISLWYYSQEGWEQCEVVGDETHGFIQSGRLCLSFGKSMGRLDDGYLIKFKLEDSYYEVPPTLEEISLNMLPVVQKDTFVEYQDFIVHRSGTIKAGKRSAEETDIEELSEDLELILDNYLSLHGLVELYILEDQGYYPCTGYELVREEARTRLRMENPFLHREEDVLNLKVVSFRGDAVLTRCYEGDGFPYQTIDLDNPDIFYESFELLVENELAPGYYLPWQKVESFSCSEEADNHYVFDDRKGMVYFGNAQKGRVPEGNILIIGYATTLGVRGNVKAQQINRLLGEEGIRISNPDNVSHGRDKETVEACFKRYIRGFRQVKRAITREDYEEIIKSTPGLMVEAAKVIPATAPNCVTIVVSPYGGERRLVLNRAYQENILRLLDKKRLVGTKVRLLSPEYIGVSVYGELAVKPHYLHAREMVQAAVEDYFKKIGQEFGKTVLYNEIYGIIDILDCVARVENLSVNAQGKGITRSMNQDLVLPPNGIVYLKDAHFSVSVKE